MDEAHLVEASSTQFRTSRERRAPTLNHLRDGMSTREAASALGRNVRSIRRAIERGELAAVKRGTAYRIAADELMRYAARGQPGAVARVEPRLVAFPADPRVASPLPQPLSSFVGRADDVAAVGDLLGNPAVRLLTLTGPGGIGKTRLALAVAEAVGERFPDGVVFVELAAVTRPEMVLPSIRQALGLREVAGHDRRQQLYTYLRAKRLLLVIDNAEHLLAAAPEISGLAGAAPGVTVLVTSRAPLRVAGEQEYPVGPLSLPAPAQQMTASSLLASDAARLFVARAQAHDPAFLVTAESAPEIADICARLDGLPLAIELAAARVKILPPHLLRDWLKRRLPLLIGGDRDAPQRHRTMRNAIAWSYGLLTAVERRLFRRLAVFAGGFSLEGVAGMADWLGENGSADSLDLDLVGVLLEQSLLTRDNGAAGEARFRMLETVREYGLERMEPEEAIQTRAAHARYMCTFARAIRPLANTQVTRTPFERLAADDANLRAALAWLHLEGPPASFVGLVTACWIYWYATGRLQEAHRWIDRAMAKRDAASRADQARLATAAAERLMVTGETAAAEAAFEEAIFLVREVGDPFDLAMALKSRGFLANATGNFEEGERYLAEAQPLAATISDARLRLAVSGSILGNLSVSARGQGQPELAAALIQEELRLVAGQGFGLLEMRSLVDLANIARDQGTHRLMAEYYQQSLAQMSERDEPRSIAEALSGTAIAASDWGEEQAALRLFSAAAAVRERAGIGMVLPGDAADHEAHLRRLRETLGEERFSAGWAAGQALAVGEAITLARASFPPAGIPPEARPTATATLTRREQDVLRLLAAGQTDRQIGEALFISPRTVSWHVGAILGKLHCTTRHEAAIRSREPGLL